MKTYSRFSIFAAHLAALAGTAYSGSIAYSKFTTGMCAFGASCPYLFGMPVCYYGFFAFALSLVLVSSVFWLEEQKVRSVYTFLYWLSLCGVFFSLYFLVYELFVLPAPIGTPLVSYGYPSCFYGLIGFGALFFSVRSVLTKWSESAKEENGGE